MEWLQKPLTHFIWATAAVVALIVLCHLPMQAQDRRVQRELLAEDRRVQRDIKLKLAEIQLARVAQDAGSHTGIVIDPELIRLGLQLGVGYDWIP